MNTNLWFKNWLWCEKVVNLTHHEYQRTLQVTYTNAVLQQQRTKKLATGQIIFIYWSKTWRRRILLEEINITVKKFAKVMDLAIIKVIGVLSIQLFSTGEIFTNLVIILLQYLSYINKLNSYNIIRYFRMK